MKKAMGLSIVFLFTFVMCAFLAGDLIPVRRYEIFNEGEVAYHLTDAKISDIIRVEVDYGYGVNKVFVSEDTERIASLLGILQQEALSEEPKPHRWVGWSYRVKAFDAEEMVCEVTLGHNLSVKQKEFRSGNEALLFRQLGEFMESCGLIPFNASNPVAKPQSLN